MLDHKLSVAPMLDWIDISIFNGVSGFMEHYRNHSIVFIFYKKVP